VVLITALPNAINCTTTPRWNAGYWFGLSVHGSTYPSAVAQNLSRLARFVQRKIDRENEFKGAMYNSIPNVMLRGLLMHYGLRKIKRRLTTRDAFYKTTVRLKTRSGHLSKRSRI
jgi:hypothetical protein